MATAPNTAPHARSARGHHRSVSQDRVRQHDGARRTRERRTEVSRLQTAPVGRVAWAQAARVRQWPKNLLLFGAPAAAGALGDTGVASRVSLAALAFCLLSSGAYLLNDLHDAPEDRRHPVKRYRPIAARTIAPGSARAAATIALAGGLGLAAGLGDASLAIAGSYALLNFLYTKWLRRIAIADITTRRCIRRQGRGWSHRRRSPNLALVRRRRVLRRPVRRRGKALRQISRSCIQKVPARSWPTTTPTFCEW